MGFSGLRSPNGRDAGRFSAAPPVGTLARGASNAYWCAAGRVLSTSCKTLSRKIETEAFRSSAYDLGELAAAACSTSAAFCCVTACALLGTFADKDEIQQIVQ